MNKEVAAQLKAYNARAKRYPSQRELEKHRDGPVQFNLHQDSCDAGMFIEFDETILPRVRDDNEDGPTIESTLCCNRLYDLGYGCIIVEQRMGMGGYLRQHYRRPYNQTIDRRGFPFRSIVASWELTYEKWHQSLDDAYAAAVKWANRQMKHRGGN
jgi:hypothetical protein